MNPSRKLKPGTFFPPFILIIASQILWFVDPDAFQTTTTSINQCILESFSSVFSWSTSAFVVIVILTWFSRISKTKFGGEDAVPMVTKWQWFAITLCTTIATGILFWGTAEPLYHLHAPPSDMEHPEVFSMSTMFMHWTFTPYAIYTLAGLIFAYSFYQLKQPFAVSSMIVPLTGKSVPKLLAQVIDSISLFALVAGMAASLGAGVLAISAGLDTFFGLQPNPTILGLITLGIVATFVVSAASGLQKGIRVLSDINIRLFVILALFVLVAGPAFAMFALGAEGTLDYVINFVPRSLGLDGGITTKWAQSWTVFYWANWLAWTPVTAVFLGKLAKGYTVRQYILFNWIFPALFGGLWMIIFSGGAMSLDLNGGGLWETLNSKGAEHVMFALLKQLPWWKISSIVFLVSAFISYVTAADSNTTAMAGMSVDGITPENQQSPLWLKLVWGGLIGLLTWIMIANDGIEGIKMLSNLGGLPALLLMVVLALGWVRVLIGTRKGQDEIK